MSQTLKLLTVVLFSHLLTIFFKAKWKLKKKKHKWLYSTYFVIDLNLKDLQPPPPPPPPSNFRMIELDTLEMLTSFQVVVCKNM